MTLLAAGLQLNAHRNLSDSVAAEIGRAGASDVAESRRINLHLRVGKVHMVAKRS